MVVYVHIVKQRFYVAVNFSLAHLEIRIERELSIDHIEVAVGSKQIIHFAHVGIFYAQRQVKIRALRFRSKRHVDSARTTAHESSARVPSGNTVFKMTAEIFDIYIGIGKKHVVSGLRRAVHVSKLAVSDLQTI